MNCGRKLVEIQPYQIRVGVWSSHATFHRRGRNLRYLGSLPPSFLIHIIKIQAVAIFSISDALTIAMAPITSYPKLHSIPTSEDQSSAKRAKLSATASKIRTNRQKPKEIASKSIGIANSLDSATFTKTYIPNDKQIFATENGDQAYTCTFLRTEDLGPDEMEACFRIIAETSKADYDSHAEEGWDDVHKRAEMCEKDMRFILVREALCKKDDVVLSEIRADNLEELDTRILGFTSFKLELDPDNAIPQIYIYEIHLRPPVRGSGLGKHLMAMNEYIAKRVGLQKSILTVFTCNERAEKMYRGMGYVDDECCPKTRKLRGGKIVRPKHLILSKAL
jgi:GNAT superfamily N-acetyltransferase